jgi:hypothetical protein
MNIKILPRNQFKYVRRRPVTCFRLAVAAAFSGINRVDDLAFPKSIKIENFSVAQAAAPPLSVKSVCALKSLVIVVALCIFLPLTAWPQTQSKPLGQSAASQQLIAGNASPSQISRDQSQDQNFLALVQVRDAQLAATAELKRIRAYHNGFQSRVGPVLDATEGTSPRVRTC